MLALVGREKKNSGYVATALEAVAYTLAQQNDDGSLCYWGNERAESCHIDHYHTGFELRSLHGIWMVTGEAHIHRAFTAYYDFYVRNLFTQAGIPKMTPACTYPVDIHTCAEAILCHSLFASDMPRSRDLLPGLSAWVVRTMQLSNGSFRYLIRRKGRLRWRVNIPYIRWGQAWMLRALAELRLQLGPGGHARAAKADAHAEPVP